MSSLEDVAFGFNPTTLQTPPLPPHPHPNRPMTIADTYEDEDDVDDPTPPRHRHIREYPPPPHHHHHSLSYADRISGIMLPTLVTLGVMLIVLYSLSKSLEYTELFVANHRYRMGLFGVNAAAVVIGCIVVSCATAATTAVHTHTG